MTPQVRILVEGLVQGVGFRWFVQQKARELALSGFARNLEDGRVEILARGNVGLLRELIKSVRIGPRAARVTNMKVEWEPLSVDATKSDTTEFEIR